MIQLFKAHFGAVQLSSKFAKNKLLFYIIIQCLCMS